MSNPSLPQTSAYWASHYAALGCALVPIEPRTKGPRSSGWQDNPITRPGAARAFWNRFPAHNMGVLHGSSNTAALDIDYEEGARLALAEIGADLDGLLESPVRIRGAKGVKPLYNALGLVLSRKVLTWPHPEKAGHKLTVLELRGGAGCQDVLPPSIHPTGISYTWDEITPSSREDLDDLPEVLIHLWENWDELRPAMEAACPWAVVQAVRAAVPFRSSVAHSISPREGESVIAAFNARYSAAELLERNGYAQKGERWSAPTSESGMAGVVMLEGKVYSHHSSDLLNDGHAHDSFSLFTLLEHGGDVRAATKEAARVLGLTRSDVLKSPNAVQHDKSIWGQTLNPMSSNASNLSSNQNSVWDTVSTPSLERSSDLGTHLGTSHVLKSLDVWEKPEGIWGQALPPHSGNRENGGER